LFSLAGIRSAKVIARAFNAGFQRMVHRFWPVPVESHEQGEQVEAFQGCLLSGEMSAHPDRAAVAGVERFNGVR
jgi:hypothetical protein